MIQFQISYMIGYLRRRESLLPFGRLNSGKIKKIKGRMQVDFVYHSNKIKGSTLSRGETELILEGVTVGKKSIPEALAGEKDWWE